MTVSLRTLGVFIDGVAWVVFASAPTLLEAFFITLLKRPASDRRGYVEH